MTTSPASLALSEAPLRQARNSAAFWTATGRSRGHDVVRRRGVQARERAEPPRRRHRRPAAPNPPPQRPPRARPAPQRPARQSPPP
ncbi:hypothetical protein ACFV5C_12820, partial [Streptomyces sp. NPDC059762]